MSSKITSATRSPTRTAAGRSEQRRDASLGRGRKQGHLRLPGDDSRAREDSRAADAALELRAVLAAVEGRPWYIFGKNDGLQNQAVVYKTTSPDAPAEVLIDPNTLSSDGTVALGTRPLHRRREVHGVFAGGQRLGLDRVARPRRRDVARICPTYQVVEVQRRRVAEGRLRILLQPLRRAEGRHGADGGQQVPEGLLPQAGHHAGRRHARVRAQGSTRLGPRRRRHRRRPVPADLSERGHEAREPGLRQGPHLARERDRAVPRQVRRRVSRRRQRRRHVFYVRPTRTRRGSGRGHQADRAGYAGVEERHSRGVRARRAGGGRRWSPTASSHTG